MNSHVNLSITRGRSLTFTAARVLVRAPFRQGRLYTHPRFKAHTQDDNFVHSMRSPCSRAHFIPVATARVSSPWDWAHAVRYGHLFGASMCKRTFPLAGTGQHDNRKTNVAILLCPVCFNAWFHVPPDKPLENPWDVMTKRKERNDVLKTFLNKKEGKWSCVTNKRKESLTRGSYVCNHFGESKVFAGRS